MKLLFIITGLSLGGAEKMLLKLASRIDKNKFDICVISLVSRGDIAISFENLDIPVYFMDISFGRFNPFLFFKLVHLIHRLKPDVVQTWLYHGDLIGGLAAILAGNRKICWNIRNSNLDKDKVKWSTRAVVKASALLSRVIPTYIICNSMNASKIHQDLGYCKSSFKIIPNGFDLLEFHPAFKCIEQIRSEFNILRTDKIIGHIARFDPHKNHLGLIKSISRVIGIDPNVQFLLCGTNVDRSNKLLSNWIREYGIESNVRLLGARDDVPRIMASLDLLVSSSVGESFPNVLGEAMACGVPCVATDVGDSAIIIGETGKIVPPSNTEALSNGMLEILALPQTERKRLGSIARERILDCFSIESVAKQYESLYFDMNT